MLKHFTYNGTSTADLGLIVNGINIYGSPSRVVEKVQVPYRNGDLLIDTGAYTNYILTYTVSIVDNVKATTEAISAWLLAPKGYHRLTDTYNTDIYRMATYYNQIDYTLTMLHRYGQANISFDCKPQKFLLSGETPLSRSSGSTVTNPSVMPSKPFMRVYGTGEITIGDYTINILNNSSFIDIDCENMQVYRGTTNLGNDVEIAEFPELPSGDTTIAYPNTITSFSITPRWWKL